MRKIIYLLVFVGILIGLFFSSSQSYEQQSLIPKLEQTLPNKPLETALSKLQIPYWGTIISVEERGYYYFVEFLLRKSAHFFIFGLLALVIYVILPKHSLRLATAALLTLLLAISDEYHQSLTSGRTATILDIYLDMAGAITFLALLGIILFIRRIWRKVKQKK